MKTILMTAGIALLAFAGLGGSDHGCNGNVIDVGGVAYIDDRDFTSGGTWIYLESNGTPGLQSGGTSPLEPVFVAGGGLLTSVDPCTHANPDTLIF